MATSWEFPRCVVDYVHDGDTIVLKSIDLGLDTFRQNIRVRFLKAKCPEINQIGGIEARDHLMTLVQPGDTVRVISGKWDKYANRIDGIIYNAQGIDLALQMFTDGFAIPY